MGGTLLIHPSQVAPARAASSPTDEQVESAREIVSAATSGGAVRVGGVMVDAPVLARARRVLLSAGHGVRSPASAP